MRAITAVGCVALTVSGLWVSHLTRTCMFALRSRFDASKARRGRARAFIGAVAGCVVLAGASTAVVVQPACSLKNCEPTWTTIDGNPPNESWDQHFKNAHFVDDYTWESSDDVHEWENFGPQANVAIQICELPGPLRVTVHLSPNRDPALDGDGMPTGHENYAAGAGNIAEISTYVGTPKLHLLGSYFRLHNDSCGQYYFRVIVQSYGPRRRCVNNQPFLDAPDAGSDASTDANNGTDAPADALTDAPIPDSAADSAD